MDTCEPSDSVLSLRLELRLSKTYDSLYVPLSKAYDRGQALDFEPFTYMFAKHRLQIWQTFVSSLMFLTSSMTHVARPIFARCSIDNSENVHNFLLV